MSTSVTAGEPGTSSAEPSRPGGGAAAGRRLAGSPALRVIGRRLLITIPVLWGVTFLTFLVLNALPGDAATALLGANATPAEIRAETIKLHLNESIWVRYWDWLVGLLHGNLGTSLYYNQPVTSILGQRIPVTLELVVYALVITFVISVPLAILSARKPRGVTDRLAKGLSRWKVLSRHALRNSFIGLITVIGLNLATLIGATVIVEQIFGLSGIGYELLRAINNRDVPLVEGIVLVFATIVVLANLATDLTYDALDPRIRHGRSRS